MLHNAGDGAQQRRRLARQEIVQWVAGQGKGVTIASTALSAELSKSRMKMPESGITA